MQGAEVRRAVTGKRARVVAVLAAAAAAGALLALSPGSGTGSRTVREGRRAAAPPAVLTGSIVQTDSQWTCSGPVALDSVTVTMDAAAQSLPRTGMDAVHLESGCTGSIGAITIVQYAADGIKVGNGAHDLVIGGGSIRCLAKAPNLHQDGIQVMSGVNITFRGLAIDCGRPGDGVINSNIFFNKGLDSPVPPTNVVCDGCSLGAGAAHTVSIQDSIASGVRDSVLCPSLYRNHTVSIGPAAVDPVNDGNQLPDACTGVVPAGAGAGSGATTARTTRPTVSSRLSIAASATVVAGGAPLVLSGGLASGRPGRQIDVYEQPYGASAQSLLASTKTDANGRWEVTVRPRIGTTYVAKARSFASAELLVRVRPAVVLHAGTRRLTVKVLTERPLTGATVAIQRRDGTRWRTVGTVVLGPRGGGVLPLTAKTAGQLRASLPAQPGYLGATSTPVTAAAGG